MAEHREESRHPRLSIFDLHRNRVALVSRMGFLPFCCPVLAWSMAVGWEEEMTEAIKIEKGVLLPETRRKESPFPFEHMEIGDSFGVPYTQHTDKTIRFAASAYGRQASKRFTVRKMAADNQIRVWRLQ